MQQVQWKAWGSSFAMVAQASYLFDNFPATKNLTLMCRPPGLPIRWLESGG